METGGAGLIIIIIVLVAILAHKLDKLKINYDDDEETDF